MAPFLSKAQRRFLHSKHPKVAEEFEKHTPKNAHLPERLGPTREQKAKERLKRGMQGRMR